MPPVQSLSFFELFFLLIAGHAVGDFALQNEWVAVNKNRHARDKFPLDKQEKMLVIWPHVLTAHALHHAFLIFLITHNATVSIAEAVVHWVTDFGKNEDWYDFHIDQYIHIGMKLVWAYLLKAGFFS